MSLASLRFHSVKRRVAAADTAALHFGMSARLHVTVWNENVHEKKNPIVAKIYPRGMHSCIADALNIDSNVEVRTATLHDSEHGLTEKVLKETDELMCCGHVAHGEVA